MSTRRPDNLPRGWLADKLRERTVRAKVTDPEKQREIFDRLGISLGPGANTVRRRSRYRY